MISMKLKALFLDIVVSFLISQMVDKCGFVVELVSLVSAYWDKSERRDHETEQPEGHITNRLSS